MCATLEGDVKTLTVDVVKYSSYPRIHETSIFSYCHEVIMLNLLNLSDCHLNPHRTFSSLEVLSTFSDFGLYTVSHLYYYYF